jgi:hypothetical protein
VPTPWFAHLRSSLLEEVAFILYVPLRLNLVLPVLNMNFSHTGYLTNHWRNSSLPCLWPMLIFACVLVLADGARAATASFTNNAPPLGPSDISQLANAADRTNNVGGSVDDQGGNFVYLDAGRPAQGQTFTTGGNASGYSLTAVTLRQVTYDTYALVRDMTYHVRITKPSGNTLTVLAEETVFVAEDASDCTTCNFPTIANGGGLGAGSGRYITLTFATPVVLNPNTTYGFDVGAESANHYWETDGTSNTNAYGGGTAYSTGVAANNYGFGLGNTTLTERTGDRVFVVALTAAIAPLSPRFNNQPSSLTLYAGRTAQFAAKATGAPTLVYQWRKNGTNVVNGGNISGATSDSLTLANITAADAGSYTLVVTNSSAPPNNVVTSAPAVLTVVAAPAPGSYGYAVFTNNPVAFWRLDETGNPATNPPSYDYAGGFNGRYEIGSLNGFNGIVGPRPSAFPGFASTNNAVSTTGLGDLTTPTWVTVPALFLDTNRVTMIGWIYPNGDQGDYTGLFVTRGGNAGFIYGGGFSSNAGELAYWWRGEGWDFDSGLTIPPNQWSFVAVVIEPTKATLYLGANGVLNSAVKLISHASEPQAFGYPADIGHQQGRNPDDRIFNGSIDDVAVFNRSLSFDEINTLYGTGLGAVLPVPPTFISQPTSQTLYTGRTARFTATVSGTSPLTYRWRKNGTNVNDGGNISGATTDTLTIANAGAGDVGAYTLVVSNAAPNGVVTSAPPASLTLVSPTGQPYESAVLAANPVAHWRLDETGNPATNAPAYDYVGGHAGTYQAGSSNGFNGVIGPRPPALPGFASTNRAVSTTGLGDNTTPTWVTIPALNLNTNKVTMTGWIYPNGAQEDYAGLLTSSEVAGFAYGGEFSANAGQLIYWWNDASTYTFVSGLTIPENQWSFVAVVIEPTKATLYLGTNSVLNSAVDSTPQINQAWGGNGQIGHQLGRGPDSRVFNGSIDEVAVFNYAFTPAQVLNLYNAAFSAIPSVTLSIERIGTNVRLSWPQGTLLEALDVSGPWTTNGNASPYTFAPAGAKKFFRVKVQ